MAKTSIRSFIRKPVSTSTKTATKTKKFTKVPSGQGDVHQPIFKPPKLLRKTPKLTVKQLLDTADARKKELAKDIAIKKLGTISLTQSTKIIPPDTQTYRVQTYSKHNKHIHSVTIFLPDGNPFSVNSHPIVDCSCSAHIFYSEMNLAKRGNSFEWRSNGEVPILHTKLQICKHTYVALRYMVRQANHGVLPRKSRTHKKMSLIRGT